MTAVTVQVTADDIMSGEPGDCRSCPIARALENLLKTDVSFSVRTEVIVWHDWGHDGVAGEADLPQAASDFIGRFDNADPVEPFSFEVDLPGELLAAVTGD